MPKQLASHLAVDEVALLRSSARLRARVLSVLKAALESTGRTQVDIAAALGIRKSAVNQVLRGAGNIQIDTLGEYLGALGFEADIVVAELGEFRNARMERRAPQLVALTLADHDRTAPEVIRVVPTPRDEINTSPGSRGIGVSRVYGRDTIRGTSTTGRIWAPTTSKVSTWG